MSRRFLFVLGWLGATFVSASVAWAAVGIVRDSVTDRPSELVADAVAHVTAAPSTTASPGAPGSTVVTDAPTTPTTGPPDTTDPGAGPSTTTLVTTTLSPPTTTTTTTAPPGDEWKTKTYNMKGGTVSIRYRPGEVRLKGAVPSPGFGVDVKNDGPTEVEVGFDGEEAETEFRARWRDGELVVDITTDD